MRRDVRRAPAAVVEVRRFPAAATGPVLLLLELAAPVAAPALGGPAPNGGGAAAARLELLRDEAAAAAVDAVAMVAGAVVDEGNATDVRPAPVGGEGASVASELLLATTAICASLAKVERDAEALGGCVGGWGAGG